MLVADDMSRSWAVDSSNLIGPAGNGRFIRLFISGQRTSKMVRPDFPTTYSESFFLASRFQQKGGETSLKRARTLA